MLKGLIGFLKINVCVKMRKMNSVAVFIMALLFILAVMITGCNTEGEEVASAKAGPTEANLGVLDEHGVSVNIPAGAFNDETFARLYLADAPVDELSVSVIAPFAEILVDGEVKRTYEPVTVTMKAELSDTDELSAVHALYFNETNGWDAIVPDSVDRKKGVVTFTTYHFSTYTIAELNEDSRVQEFLNRKSVETWVSQNTDAEGDAAREELVREILSEGLGITDASVLSIITNAIIEELPGGKVVTGLMSGDSEKTTEEVLKATAKGLAKGLKDSPVLKELADEPGHIISTARAAAAAVEGEGQLALEHMAEHIVDYVSSKTPVIKQLNKITKTWVKVVDHTINVWEYEEVEKAYQVYRDGASSRVPFWGYNVEPGNFDDVWEQMSGISVKITRDALQSYADARGITVDEISFEQQNKIREDARARLERQFKERSQREREIEAIRDEQMTLLEAYAEKGLLERSFSNPMYTEHDDLESLLRRITQLTERIKRDTGRFAVVSSLHGAEREYDDVGVLREDEILVSQLADLVWVWYNNGPEAYEDKLIELGLVEEDDPVDVIGTWLVDASSIKMVQGFEGMSLVPADDSLKITISPNYSVDAGEIGSGDATFDPETKEIVITTDITAKMTPTMSLNFKFVFSGTAEEKDGITTMEGTGRGYIDGVYSASFNWAGKKQ